MKSEIFGVPKHIKKYAYWEQFGPADPDTNVDLFKNAQKLAFDPMPENPVFWSGYGNRERAEAFCRENPEYQTLNIYLSRLYPQFYNELIKLDEDNLEAAEEIWEYLSAKFSRYGYGNARTFVLGSDLPYSVSEDIENKFDDEITRANIKYLASFGPSAIDDLKFSDGTIGKSNNDSKLQSCEDFNGPDGEHCRNDICYDWIIDTKPNEKIKEYAVDLFGKNINNAKYQYVELPFYKNFRLYRLIASFDDVKSSIYFWFQFNEKPLPVSWNKHGIYSFNELAPLEITKENVIEYFKFFFYFSRSGFGQVIITEKAEDIIWNKNADDSEKNAVISELSPVVFKELVDEKIFKLSCNCLVGTSLYKSDVLIYKDGLKRPNRKRGEKKYYDNGEVQLLNEQLLYSNLNVPIFHKKYLIGLLNQFFESDLQAKRLLIVEHPELLSNQANNLINEMADLADSEDQRDMCIFHAELLKDCTENGIKETFDKIQQDFESEQLQRIVMTLAREPQYDNFEKLIISNPELFLGDEFLNLLQKAIENIREHIEILKSARVNGIDFAFSDYKDGTIDDDLPQLVMDLIVNLDDIKDVGYDLSKINLKIKICNEILNNISESSQPSLFGIVHKELGDSLRLLGDVENSLDAYNRSIQSCEIASRLLIAEEDKFSWASNEINLGNALMRAYEETKETDYINDSCVHYRNALDFFSKSEWPIVWAQTASNLANALRLLIELDKCDERSVYESIEMIGGALIIFKANSQEFEFNNTLSCVKLIINTIQKVKPSIIETDEFAEKMQEIFASLK